ncbi:hypothetical protein P9112_002670 [Eukaryota sp. TZLM1-RC]
MIDLPFSGRSLTNIFRYLASSNRSLADCLVDDTLASLLDIYHIADYLEIPSLFPPLHYLTVLSFSSHHHDTASICYFLSNLPYGSRSHILSSLSSSLLLSLPSPLLSFLDLPSLPSKLSLPTYPSLDRMFPGDSLIHHRNINPGPLDSCSKFNSQIPLNNDFVQLFLDYKIQFLTDQGCKCFLFEKNFILDFDNSFTSLRIRNLVFFEKITTFLINSDINISNLSFLSLAGIGIECTPRRFSNSIKEGLSFLINKSQLESLNFSYNKLRQEGIKFLVKNMGVSQSLKFLNLSSCNVGVSAVQSLCQSIAVSLNSLETLILSHNDIKFLGFSELVSIPNSRVKKLVLNNCNIQLVKNSELKGINTENFNLSFQMLDLSENFINLDIFQQFLTHSTPSKLIVGCQMLYRREIAIPRSFITTLSNILLDSLDISYSVFNEYSELLFVNYLALNSPRILVLKSCSFVNPGLVIDGFVKSLEKRHLPRIFDLSSCNLSHVLTPQIFPLLFKGNPVSISLNYLSLTPMHLRNLFFIPQSLVSLSIGNSKIGGNSNIWTGFSVALKGSCVKNLNLSGQRPHLEAEFFKNLAFCTTLASLNLSDSLSSPSLVFNLMNNFPDCLRELNLSNISFGKYLPRFLGVCSQQKKLKSVFIDRITSSFDLVIEGIGHLSRCNGLETVSLTGVLPSNIVNTEPKVGILISCLTQLKQDSLMFKSTLKFLNLTLCSGFRADLLDLENCADQPRVYLIKPQVMAFEQLAWDS